MKKVSSAEYKDYIGFIDKQSCGAVYPLSVAEGTQSGDIYTDGYSALFWHFCGFAFLYGRCDSAFLDSIYELFLAADTSRRFVLFSVNRQITDHFSRFSGLVKGTRYFFEYGGSLRNDDVILPDGYRVCELDRALVESSEGRITPRFSWNDLSDFEEKGKGFCVVFDENVASWAFSAAVSTEETDIGVETDARFRNKGLALAAARKMTKYCIAHGKRPVWACDANNTASRGLAEKLGFTFVSQCETFRKN